MRFLRVLGVVVLIVVVLAAVQALRGVPKPALQLQQTAFTVPGAAPQLPWPSAGEAAVSVQSVGEMGNYGGETPIPIGSVAKIMTALIVLEKHPLAIGDQGPTVTVTAAQAAQYQAVANSAQSLVKVVAGEQLTEYQLLQGLLIPSGNNIANILADWIAGSQSGFVQMMNQKAKALRMTHTTYADASGLSPATISTATDQLHLAEVAMENPVFAQIVAQPQVLLPQNALLYNYDNMVGHQGIVGIKTGSTLASGGCFVFAAQRTAHGQPIVVLGAVFGQVTSSPTQSPLQAAISESLALVDAAAKAVHPVRLVAQGAQVAALSAPWHSPVAVTTRSGAEFLGWGGLQASYRLRAPQPKAPIAAGASLGKLTLRLGAQRATLGLESAQPLPGPSWRWRLTRL